MRILTFDIEDWFHILDLESVAAPATWDDHPPRIREGVGRILDLLAEHNVRASFFVLGWVAEKYPDIVRQIDALGFEIGSHSHYHQLIYNMTPTEFADDLHRSVEAIQNVIGKKVRMFRAPGFSLTDDCLWSFDVFAKKGIEIDCSLFATARNHGGIGSIPARRPCRIVAAGIEVREFPMSIQTVFKRPIVFSGGGYFRFLPYAAIRRLTAASPYTMTYFHPRDFDPMQPRLEMPLRRRFQTYVGLRGAMTKLRAYLNDFEFCDVARADTLVDWNSTDRFIAQDIQPPVQT